MKKLISIFLIIITLIISISTYGLIKNKDINAVYNAEEEFATEFSIDNFSGNDKRIHDIIYDISKEMKVNVFRTFISYTKDDNPEIVKYVLLNNETRFFDNIKLSDGRYFEEADFKNVDSFISSIKTEDRNQIGVLNIIGGKDLIQIKPLKSSYNYHLAIGKYYVETKSREEYVKFIKVLTQKINYVYGTNYMEKDFETATDNLRVVNNIDIPKSYNLILLGIVLLLIIYELLNSNKKIGIMRLNGIGKLNLWYKIIGKFIMKNLLMMVGIVVAISLFIKNTNINFFINIFLILILYFLVISIISFLLVGVISISSINSLIKNKKNTNLIIGINLILKILISIFIMGNVVDTINYYFLTTKKLDNLKSWEIAKDFGMFYPVSVGNDTDQVKSFDDINEYLYPVLNEMGSILINTKSYENDMLINNNLEVNSIKINDNYLEKFPIYDLNNEKIRVVEEETDHIILIPEKYRDKKEYIESYLSEIRKDFIEAEQSSRKEKLPESITSQKVRVIWTKNNQKIFSFNPEVFINDNNMITDPIIEVITLNNSVPIIRDSILGAANSDPLKIKLYDRDPKITLDRLQSVLKKYELEDNLNSLMRINDLVMKQLYELKQNILSLMLINIGILVIYIILSIQNIVLIFNKNMKKIILNRLFGVSFLKTYKSLIRIFIVSWIIQIVAFSMLKSIAELRTLFIIALLMLIELIISLFTIIRIEKVNKLRIVKEGF
ncbi:MAG: DUF1430 domain-containing protein [Clostridium sp.]